MPPRLQPTFLRESVAPWCYNLRKETGRDSTGLTGSADRLIQTTAAQDRDRQGNVHRLEKTCRGPWTLPLRTSLTRRRGNGTMPALWLDRYECRDGELPPVCMVCGAEATTTIRQTFR